MAIYADDTALYKTHWSLPKIVRTLDEHLERIAKWMDLGRVKVNADKCQYIVLTLSNRRTLDMRPTQKLRVVSTIRTEGHGTIPGRDSR